MTQEAMTLHVDTGSQLFNIDDKGEIIGQFRFNPADPNIARRYEQVIEKLNAITISDNAPQEEMFAATDEIQKQLDYLLNYKVSDQIFAKANPLTPLESGEFYFENVVNAIAKIIETVTDKRLKKLEKVQKATAKYHK